MWVGGNADIFIGGRYIPGVWSRASIGDPTVFYDDHGQELRFPPRKNLYCTAPERGSVRLCGGTVTASRPGGGNGGGKRGTAERA